MTFTMNERRSITKETKAKYQKASKKQKMEITALSLLLIMQN